MVKKFIKQKVGEQLGFKTPNFVRANRFGSPKNASQNSFNPARFKVQHKG